jgi:hypothetical protein
MEVREFSRLVLATVEREIPAGDPPSGVVPSGTARFISPWRASGSYPVEADQTAPNWQRGRTFVPPVRIKLKAAAAVAADGD